MTRNTENLTKRDMNQYNVQFLHCARTFLESCCFKARSRKRESLSEQPVYCWENIRLQSRIYVLKVEDWYVNFQPPFVLFYFLTSRRSLLTGTSCKNAMIRSSRQQPRRWYIGWYIRYKRLVKLWSRHFSISRRALLYRVGRRKKEDAISRSNAGATLV